MYQKNSYGKLTMGILEVLFDCASNLIDKAIDRHSAYNAFEEQGFKWTHSKFSLNLKKLEERGYLKFSPAGDSITFTKKASLKLIDKITSTRPGDGKFRFISFDIPEQWSRRRNLFRRAIKRLGFRQIQKSLWVTDKPVGDLVENACLEYKVKEYVMYIVAEATDVDKTIKQKLSKKEK